MKIRVMICLLGILLLSGCSDAGKDQDTSTSDQEQEISIGMIFDTFVIERWQRDRDKFVYTAGELGASVDVQNANGEIEKQKEQMDYLIEKEVDVIVIVAIDGYELAEHIDKAAEAGIKVIAYDRMIFHDGVDLYIGFDNYKVGTLMGEYMADALDPGDKVLMINGADSDNNVLEVEAGFEQIMEEREIEVLDATYTPGWKRELAAEYLNQHPEYLDEVAGIMCGNDDLAAQVIQVLSENRRIGDIVVVGQDADLETCQRIMETTQLMTVYKSVDDLAKRAAEEAVKLAKDGQVNSSDVRYDREVPYICLEPLAVTSDNMEEVIIQNGFHSREDILDYFVVK